LRAPSPTITELAQSASNGVGQADSSLGTMLALASETSRKVAEVAAANTSRRDIVAQMERLIDRFSGDQQHGRLAVPAVDTSALRSPLGSPPWSPRKTPCSVKNCRQGEQADEIIEELEAADD